MRADAQRNRQRLVTAAIELVLEVGGEPTRDAVAQRAGVGIGTLYRHFPDSQSLLRAVALEAIDRAIEHGNAALAESPNGRGALRRYLHGAIDTGLGAVNIVHPLLNDHDWSDRRDAAEDLLERLVATAEQNQEISTDVTSDEIALAAIRFCRPLAIGLDPARERSIAHRQLDCYLDGLATHH
ncbi:MAG: TetR/AcrR family transcriptional regulator [Ilumatobacteraceae bacterium]|uniref:TetR/AcrR family transcriptional regulator n=1 Tax=Ilumatobacter fluminis TaxID=467091 RepID=UPI002968EA3A|nr:TetR/AcrR family transcriptional regulator [Ilumatobacteraceae bacterium]